MLSPLLSAFSVRRTGAMTVDEICRASPQFARWRASQPTDVADMPLYGGLLHPLPDGRWTHALHLFDGMTLTQRVGAPHVNRTDLHVTASLDPVLAIAREPPLTLRSGRQIDVTFTLARGRVEDPQLLAHVVPPLDELLFEPIDLRRADIWRELMACRQDESCDYSIVGMPHALYAELCRRADHYGMTADQFVILALRHLAWRTPFAEDMAPFESWVTHPTVQPARLRLAE